MKWHWSSHLKWVGCFTAAPNGCLRLCLTRASTAIAMMFVTVSAAQRSGPNTIEGGRDCDRLSCRIPVQVRLNKGNLQSSVDGAMWKNCALPVKTFLRAVTYGKGQIVAVGGSYCHGSGAVIITSRDAAKWEQRKIPTGSMLYAVMFGDGLFVAVGEHGVIFTSTNGVCWTKRDSICTDVLLAAVAFGNGRFVAGGESGTIISSTNGVNWTRSNLGSSIYTGRIAFTNGLFLAGSGTDLFSCSNGLRWKRTSEGQDVSAAK